MRAAVLCASLSLFCGAAAMAASPDGVDLRIDKLEKEMHAVQRKVFPNGNPVEPEIATTAPRAAEGSAASTPLVDITQRVDLLEAQVKTLTGQVEQYSIHLRKIDDENKALEARIKTLETPPVAAPPLVAPSTVAPVKRPKAVKVTSGSAPTSTSTATVAATPAATPPKSARDPKREAKVAAVILPDTGDAIEDSYTYGYRLFAAKLYPEAEVKLTEFVGKYPKSPRFTFAQNLLGRAYFEEGKYANAARAFVDNFDKMPQGERAPESLSWAGLALIKDGAPAKACKVYEAFAGVYGKNAPRDVLDRVAKGRVDAQCSG